MENKQSKAQVKIHMPKNERGNSNLQSLQSPYLKQGWVVSGKEGRKIYTSIN